MSDRFDEPIPMGQRRRDMLERLVEVHRITEMRDGCVYRTQAFGFRWVGLDEHSPEGWIWAPPSTSFDGPTIRWRKEGQASS